MSNESKPAVPSTEPSQSEPVSANRRAFMKTVVTGTVAAGLVAGAGKAEAATAAAVCGMPEQFPSTAPVSVKLLVNRNMDISIDRLWEIINGTFGGSGCPNCGLIGHPHDPNGPFPISDISIQAAYLAKDVDSMVVIQDASIGGNPCK